jgi:hypothetical protein
MEFFNKHFFSKLPMVLAHQYIRHFLVGFRQFILTLDEPHPYIKSKNINDHIKDVIMVELHLLWKGMYGKNNRYNSDYVQNIDE